jgi:hypothetical protein
MPIFFLVRFLPKNTNISYKINYLSKLIKMPIYMTGGIEKGELRLFEVQRPKLSSTIK